VRLHRGKLALRHLLATDLREEAAAFGLGSVSSGTWQEMSVWCPACGQRRLQGRLDAENTHLLIRCSSCSETPYIDHHTRILKDVTTCRAAFNRVLDWAAAYFPPALERGSARCVGCGRMAPVRLGLPFPARAGYQEETSMYIDCVCRRTQNTGDLSILALASQEGRRFFRAHPRTQELPLAELEVGGVPALRVSFVSLTETARLDLLAVRDTLQLIQVNTTF
jgi:hypothetical protein